MVCPDERGIVQGRKLKGATAGVPVSGAPADSVVRDCQCCAWLYAVVYLAVCSLRQQEEVLCYCCFHAALVGLCPQPYKR